MYFTKTKQLKKRGFTLIELLVVISIIAVLMSIMMPALHKAREQASKNVCASRLRSVSGGVFLFAADNKDWLPMADGRTFVDKSIPDGCQECLSIGSSYPHKDLWYKEIANYMSIKDDPYLKSSWSAAENAGLDAPKIYQCPSMKKTVYNVRGLAYGWNAAGLGNKCKDYYSGGNKYWYPRRISEIRSAAVTGMIGENPLGQDPVVERNAVRYVWGGEVDMGYTGGRYGFYYYGDRHSGGSSYIAVDGHVEYRKIDEYIEDWHKHRQSRTGGGIIYPNPRKF